jgi:hypothetical protein
MAPSITQGAVSLSWRSAAMNVWVFQWPTSREGQCPYSDLTNLERFRF